MSLSAPRRRSWTSQLQNYRVKEYRLPSPPSYKCNVLRESLSVDSQNIPCETIEKRRGSWVISVYLWKQSIGFVLVRVRDRDFSLRLLIVEKS